jgi:glycosyltransferase involved in cell wall biosynthesis
MASGMNPFFSVVIPTFNRANKLKKTLDSVVAQSFANFEVLVMDDGSTDDTQAVVESFRDSRIRYEWAPNSGGPATPRNRGIDAAKAGWVCFLDADDLWYPEKLQLVSEAIAQNPDSDLICHNEVKSVLATQSKSLLSYGPYEHDFYRLTLTLGNRVSTSATTVKRSFLNKHDLRFNQSPDYVIVEDYDMWLRIAFFGGVFHFIAEPLGEYIIEDDNISSNLTRIRHNQLVVLRDHVFNLQQFEPNKDRLWRGINAGLLISRAKGDVAAKQYASACNLLFAAVKISIAGSMRYVFIKSIGAINKAKS